MENMKNISVDSRPNIGVEKMSEYENGGLCIEKEHVNGVSVYIPYGVFNDIFTAIDLGAKFIGNGISENKRIMQDLSSNEAIGNNDALITNLKINTEELQKYKDILEQISPLQNEV